MDEYDQSNYVILFGSVGISGFLFYLASLNFTSSSSKWFGAIATILAASILLYTIVWFSKTRIEFNDLKIIEDYVIQKDIKSLVEKMKEDKYTKPIVEGLIKLNATDYIPEIIEYLDSECDVSTKLVVLDALVYFGNEDSVNAIKRLILKTEELTFKFQLSLAEMKLKGRNSLGEKTIEKMLIDEGVEISNEEKDQYEEVKKELKIYDNRNQIEKRILNITEINNNDALFEEYKAVIKMQQNEIGDLTNELKELDYSVSHEDIIKRKMNRMMIQIDSTQEDNKDELKKLNSLYSEYEQMLKEKKTKFFETDLGKVSYVLLTILSNAVSIILTWVFSK